MVLSETVEDPVSFMKRRYVSRELKKDQSQSIDVDLFIKLRVVAGIPRVSPEPFLLGTEVHRGPDHPRVIAEVLKCRLELVLAVGCLRTLHQHGLEGTRQPKVPYLHVQVLIEEYVLWLEVPVYHVGLVNSDHTLKHL